MSLWLTAVRHDITMPVMAESFRHLFPRDSVRRAFTLSETLIVVAVLGLLLIVAALATEGVRTELKRRQAVALLASLEAALTAYQHETGSWPADAATDALTSETPQEGTDATGDGIIAVLAASASSRAVLETIPAVLRIRADTPDGGYGPPTGSWGTLQDPWGHRLRCLTAASSSQVHRKAVAARNGRPIFISAGVDGRFGEIELSHASDNLRSDELRRE